MTALLHPDEWVDTIDREYLDDFIKDGGASIKFAVACGDSNASSIAEQLKQRAKQRSYVTIEISAGATRVHLIDKFFDAVATQVPWDELTTRVLVRFAQENGLNIPAVLGDSLERSLAHHNGLDAAFVRATLERPLGQVVFRDRLLTKEFRLAMTWMCRARLRGGEEGAIMRQDIERWLQGTPAAGVMARQYSIFTKVNRFNARYFFASLVHWIASAGLPGTVITVDITGLTAPRRSGNGANFYTKAALLDAYEVMRQFVDSTDELTNLLLCFVADESLLDTQPGSRGLGAYQALQNRIFDEVRDRDRVNPMGSLVRLGVGSFGSDVGDEVAR